MFREITNITHFTDIGKSLIDSFDLHILLLALLFSN